MSKMNVWNKDIKNKDIEYIEDNIISLFKDRVALKRAV